MSPPLYGIQNLRRCLCLFFVLSLPNCFPPFAALLGPPLRPRLFYSVYARVPTAKLQLLNNFVATRFDSQNTLNN